jgi:pimeloyl-ACP methyl ester carboxylesterase
LPVPDLSTAGYAAAVESRGRVHMTPCGDGQMVWREWGEGRPVVLLHGGYGSWLHWLRNVRDLAKAYRVLVPDLPGNGDSAMPPLPFTPTSLADLLADGLTELLAADETFDLVGFSFGGIVSGCLAAVLPARVGTLVLLGPNGMALPFEPMPRLERLGEEMTAKDIADAHRHNLAALMIADPARVDDMAVFIQAETTRQARLSIKGMPEGDDLVQALPAVRARICGLWGGRDAFVGGHMQARRELLGRFQNDLDFRVIEGAGHWVPFETPGPCNTILLEMLAGA